MKEVNKHDLDELLQTFKFNVKYREHVSAVPISLTVPPELANSTFELSIPKSYRNSPEHLIACWFVALNFNAYWKEELRLFILKQCKRYKYEGKWMELFHYSRLFSFDLVLFYSLQNYRSSNDIKGNVLPICKQITERNLIRIYVKKQRQAKKPQFKRGYNDKGSRRPDHEIHSCYEGESVVREKIDLSDSVTRKNNLMHFLYG